MAKFSSVVIGNESLLVQCCDKLLAAGHGISAVVTRNPDIGIWAADQGIPVIAPGNGLADRLPQAFDYLLSISNLDIIPASVLALPSKGAVNFHDGPLPRHAGLNAPVWALIEGETRHGITWHMIEGGVDEGDLLVTRGFDISGSDTALTLNAKAFEAAIDSFDEVLGQLATGLTRLPQDLSQRSYHALADRPSAHGLLDFGRPATDLARLVRALDHGGYANPLSAPKVRAGGRLWLVGEAKGIEGRGTPGEILEATDDHLTVACGSGALRLARFAHVCGAPARVAQVGRPGGTLDPVLPEERARIDTAIRAVAPHESFWRARLAALRPFELAGQSKTPGEITSRALSFGEADFASVVAAFAARHDAHGSCDIAFSSLALSGLAKTGVIAPWVPLRVEAGGYVAAVEARMAVAQAEARKRVGFATDLPARAPELSGAPQVPHLGLSMAAGMIPGTLLTVEQTAQGILLHADSGRLPAALAELIAARLELIAAHLAEGTEVRALPILPEAERAMVIDLWNATGVEHDRGLTVQAAFEAQVAKTPEAVALVFEGQSLSYADLDARANRAAHVLRGMGVGPGVVAGLCTRRSVDLLVGALGILKAGGAYLPLDPAYPADRLKHYIADSGAPVIVTQSALAQTLPEHAAQLLLLDADPRLSQAPAARPEGTSAPEDVAYLIYTSGSTGTPKGVMVEHRNVVNFFCGMDAVVPREPAGTWLAVTSLSFDISVLELFYTLARGFKVVLTSDEDRTLISKGAMPLSDQRMDFSLYYWGNDDGAGRDKYRLLLEGAKFGDRNGFCAVWTPERHFHAFGGPYPNPSVTGAAVAAVTETLAVRAGSVVSPLHHPARIAEEWAVIDNLTNGRAGLALASGWQPDDFVLRPENTPPDNKSAVIENISQIRDLWAGRPVAFPRKDGTTLEVVTQPRPVSKDLPLWLTVAGNPQTWKDAGTHGCNVLTHLLGQSIDDVAEMIRLYHAALREAGRNPKDFTVTLMLHSYVAETREAARETARGPMREYLRSAAALIKQYAWAFPAFKRPKGVNNAFDLDLDILEPEDLEAILDFAFERYFTESGLFGTVEDALERTEQLKRIGVGEIACLIDYGIAVDTVLEGLVPLAEVVKRANVAPELAEDDFSIAAQILRHGVTHLQCTPSMARMIAMNDEARFALSKVDHLFLGGEPLPGALVEEFGRITGASLTNMYGPTETTIWSSTEDARGTDGVVNIGLPLANQQLYVLDEAQQPVGVGVPGELWIGGEGVTRGYWGRADLTAERFVPNPFHPGRMYRTGDLVRRRMDGRIDFIGRVDHQVKLRGYRIELGEIEAVMEAQTGISQAVVVAREDTPGDLRLVGYYTAPAEVKASALRSEMGRDLPAFMVPSHFVKLEAFPLTPNKKVDRKALPAPVARRAGEPASGPMAKPDPLAPSRVVAAPVAPGSAPGAAPAAETARTEALIAGIWSTVLGVQGISGRDNFFELGGHSLLAVQTHRAIRDELGVRGLSITDIFRFPVLADLAARVAGLAKDAPARAAVPRRTEPIADTGADPVPTHAVPDPERPLNERARMRSDAMTRRREMRARRSA
ncbi:MupA/Atu3671 family FMN-dependent luciferase-like monooxygenase [Salipiger mangrovisoli]|uniref:LLM class flavin-dependent oxidoreductase n=1 Tax=Salipiger mangrovisoli TaxID=2865933 RepID=A0ABR9WXP1_9RHOB|nr:MupA/Atu3671 family FMN-dependent luciferase-like monooxygenase [Salipiger mangrovisoli]MBE9636032.1 LLM class flavin-dependent oxidoreductase [Salipiger mangrovisoli]